MKTKSKYEYLRVIQGCYDGRTWDDCCAYLANSPKSRLECKTDYKLYCENEPQYPHRVIERRVLRDASAVLK